MSAPLESLRVLEFEGIGPVPHAGMLLTDLGAETVRVAKPRHLIDSPFGDYGRSTHVLRGRVTVSADLKNPDDLAGVQALAAQADVLIESNRPGVMERLGFEPEAMLARNPGLVYARMTGWGQTGPRAMQAGHDINYLAVTGALHALGTQEQPMVPLGFVGDYGGGSMFLMVGILAALLERGRTGKGQVVDAAMVDGVGSLMQPINELRAGGEWTDSRLSNVPDGGAPFYRAYRCSDGGFVAVGCAEEEFYRLFVSEIGLDLRDLPDRSDKRNWPVISDIFAKTLAAHPRDHWAQVFADSDACVTPVLSFDEAPSDPQVAFRRSLTATEHGVVSGQAPRLGDYTWTATEATTRSLGDQVARWSRRA